MSERWTDRFTRIGGSSPNGLGNLLFKENQRRRPSGISPECTIQTAQVESDGSISIMKSFGKYRTVIYTPIPSVQKNKKIVSIYGTANIPMFQFYGVLASPKTFYIVDNFEGAVGATSWNRYIDPAWPSVSFYSGGSQLSNEEVKFGDTSMLTSDYNYEFDSESPYLIPGDYTIEFFIMCKGDWPGVYPPSRNLLWIDFDANDGYAWVSFRFDNWYGTNSFRRRIYDNTGTLLIDEFIPFPFTPNVWQHFAVVSSGKDIMYFIGGVKQGTWPSSVDTPINSCYRWIEIWKSSSNKFFVDAFSITEGAKYTENFTPPTEPPVPPA
jgi:hypothetical protein